MKERKVIIMNKAEIRRNPDMLYPCMEIPDVTAEPAEGTFYKNACT